MLPSSPDGVQSAARRLAAGSVVAIPTETVYGLAADAHNPAAIRRVFELKGRPPDHPVIVHLPDDSTLGEWAQPPSGPARDLAEANWPGPLTLVLRRRPWVPDQITGGQDTVAVRIPANDSARSVMAHLAALTGGDGAVVAPSANRFGKVSPTSAADVIDELGAFFAEGDAVLDGGSARVGLESTIVLDGPDGLRVLRPGAVVLPESDPGPQGEVRGGREGPRVPGALRAHYAPSARVVVAELPAPSDSAALLGDDTVAAAESEGGGIGLIAPDYVATPPGWLRLLDAVDSDGYARGMYAALRRADALALRTVVAVPPARGAVRAAILDRLARAAAGSSPAR